MITAALLRRCASMLAFTFAISLTSLQAETISPGLKGRGLREALRREYTPTQSLGYDNAREKMFSRIDNDNGQVRLIYAGETFETNTIPNGNLVNTEHTWPQSKFKNAPRKERPKSDLHHLFPSYASVNQDRGNNPFSDIPDEQTKKWWRTKSFQRAMPDSEINAFSESTFNSFEPREADKGNIARAMFYFYTVYEDQNIDLAWFAPQKETLLVWHRNDPADNAEIDRSHRIAAAQGNDNPFVLDATLADRIFQESGPDRVAVRAPASTSPTSPLVDEAPFGIEISPDVMYAHIIDVGQGNCALLEFSCGAMLIDAGGQNANTTRELLEYLDEFFERRQDLNRTIESIILTHNHVDHTQALREVIESFNVKRVVENGIRGGYPEGDRDVDWVNEQAQSGIRQIKVIDVSDSQIRGNSGYSSSDFDPLNCNGVDPVITMMSADLAEDPGWGSEEFGDKNNGSVVVRVRFGGSSFLFTGDLEEPAIETMVEWYKGSSALDVDVYHVGHHGSHNGTTESLMEAMTPQIALISMSHSSDTSTNTGFVYGHPREITINKLESSVSSSRIPKTVKIATGMRRFKNYNASRAIFGTGWDGTIVVRADQHRGYQIITTE